MQLHVTEAAFLEELARTKASWTSIASKTIANSQDPSWSEHSAEWEQLSRCIRDAGAEAAFEKVIAEILSGLIHSTLVTLDGGTVLAETTLLTVRDDEGHEFKRFLHEFWPEYADQNSQQA